MNLLNKLTLKNLKLNKKRTIVTIVGIILSVALLTAVSSMYSSVLKSLINFEVYEKGYFHVLFKDVDNDGLIKIESNRKIDRIFITHDIGYAKLDDCKNEYKPYAFVKGFSKEALENLSIKLIEGRLPENDSEIIIPTHLKSNGRIEYKVGDTITLNVGDRVSDGEKLNQSNPYSEDNNEKIINIVTKEYKIVGLMERPATNIESYDAPGYTFATLYSHSDSNDLVDAYVRYNKEGKKDYTRTTAEIIEVDPDLYKKYFDGDIGSLEESEKIFEEVDKAKYQTDVNAYLIMLESNPLSDGTMKSLGVVVFIVCIIIIVSSVFCIKNSFDISIVEKTKQYGMLRSVGATKKQIKQNVLYEAFILGLIGIPLGVLLGLLATFILCIVSNYLLKGLAGTGFNIEFVINLIAIIFSVILGIITIYLSAIKSAIKASSVSPIDSIRNSGNIKIRKQYNSKIINKLFGIGGVISYKNIKRNKKKYRTTIISIIVSTTIFIALTYFVTLFYTSVEQEIGRYDYNIQYSYHPQSDNDIKKIYDSVSLDSVTDYSIIREQHEVAINIESISNSNYQDTIDGYNYNVIVMSIGDYQYNKYISKLKLGDDIKDKGILFDYFTFVNDKDRDTLHTTKYKVGDTIKLGDEVYDNDTDETSYTNIKEIEIGAIVEETPYSISYNSLYSPLLIISDSMMEKLYPDYVDHNFYSVNITSSDPDKLQDTLNKEVFEQDNLYIINLKEQKDINDKLMLLICIFLYGFIIVVTLIGITNIFNTITTNMELRRPEFAMLKSVGMTTKEFNRMIGLECVFICFKALIISIILGCGLSYLIYYKLSSGTIISFKLPILAILGSIIGVLLLIYIIMKFSLVEINKQNTIETIRNENI